MDKQRCLQVGTPNYWSAIVGEVNPSDYARWIAQIDDCIKLAKATFGNSSPLLTHYCQIRLAAIVEGIIAREAGAALQLAPEISRISELLFGVRSSALLGNEVGIDLHYRYAFKADDYRAQYAMHADRFKGAVHSALKRDDRHDALFERYLYVIGPCGQWRYLRTPQPIDVTITKRRSFARFPFHPLLATDFDYEVALAGEVSFAWPAGRTRPSVVYINNVSGHYRPLDWKSTRLNAAARSVLELDDESSVIAVANDGSCVSGPLANAVQNTATFHG